MDIEQLRTICLQLPAVTEDVKWDHDLVFSIGDKMFCVASLEPPFTCSFKVPDAEYEELSVQQGFKPAPYMARAKWVLITQPNVMNKRQWEERIRQSYDLVTAKLTKKLRESLGILK
jgi:predicted DNA-binding protein (MmcQ/YjbR family)